MSTSRFDSFASTNFDAHANATKTQDTIIVLQEINSVCVPNTHAPAWRETNPEPPAHRVSRSGEESRSEGAL